MKQFALFIGMTALIAACQKKIDIDLNEAGPKLVIEANYNAEDSMVFVRITETASYFGSSSEPIVETAGVTITDQSGNATVVPYSSNGNYILHDYIPQFNTTYTLYVEHNGVTYSASCELNAIVPQSDIFIEQSTQAIGGGVQGGESSDDTTYIAFLVFQDPAAPGDFYQGEYTVNGAVKSGIENMILLNDDLTNGNMVTFPVFGRTFKQGDSLEIDFRAVDKTIYDYFTELQTLTETNSAAPANPDYFWSNGALGYFNAYGSSKKFVIFP